MSNAALAHEPAEAGIGARGTITARVWVIVVGAAIGLLALALRAYELRDVPRLTDETDEVMRGLSIARGDLLPLTDIDAYVGPLWNYLLALCFLIVGPSALLPRIVTMAVGLATVAATAWLGWEIALRLGWPTRKHRAELLSLGAALLLATSSFHAIVSSRIAWSHALTPIMLTVALVLLVRWERTQSTPALAGAGLAYGLAVGTHPTALAAAPGLGIWALLHWRRVLLNRAGWIAFALFLLANLPLVTYNLASGFGSAAAAAQVQGAYAGAAPDSSGGYLGNLGALLTSLPLLLVGEIGERRGAMLALDDPLPFLYAGLAAVGLLATVRGRFLLPILLIGSTVIMLPLVNGKYEPLFNGRYVAPLLPLGFVLLATGVTTLVSLGARPALRYAQGKLWPPRFEPGGQDGRAPGTMVSGAILALLTVPSLLSLHGYVDATLRDGPNNRELYRAAEIAGAASFDGPVLVDASLSGTRQSTGRDGTGVLEYLLILDQRLDVRRYQPNDLAQAVERGEGSLVIVAPRLLQRLDKDFITEVPSGEEEARRRRRAGFAIIRIVRPA